MALSALVHVRGRFGAFLLHLLTALSNCGEHSTDGRRSTPQESLHPVPRPPPRRG